MTGNHEDDHICLQKKTMVQGRLWKLFSVSFETADGKFVTYIHAINAEHAAAIVEEMRDSLKLEGRMV